MERALEILGQVAMGWYYYTRDTERKSQEDLKTLLVVPMGFEPMSLA